MSVEIEGLGNVLDAISNIADEQELKRALGQACALVVGEAVKKVKKGSGELQRSIQFEVENDSGDLVGVVFTPLYYAPYVEYGTGLFAENGGKSGYWVYVKEDENSLKSGGEAKSSKSYTLADAKKVMAYLRSEGLDAYYTNGQPPQPFLRPALHENRENILRLLKGGLKGD